MISAMPMHIAFTIILTSMFSPCQDGTEGMHRHAVEALKMAAIG